jgi:Protein of unknown function DUF262/Protein of unknown function (DUF1524)
MDAHKETLSKILSMPTRLVAPLFQRPYVWNKNDNWEPLWMAFLEVLDRRLSQSKTRPYFMGAIVLDKIKGQTGSVPCREIIDGQQRMTTLQIMLEAGRKVFGDSGFEYQSNQLRKLIRNDIDEEAGPDSEEQFKVWPTNVDREPFRKVMTGKSAVGLMSEAFIYFEGCIKEWLNVEQSGAKDRASAFVRAVNEDLLFVAIDLTDDDDDGQLIFETLNALGTPLLPSDLVKNLLFRSAASEGLDTDRLYAEYWKPFEEDSAYWRGKVSVGRRDRIRLDLFLQYYLTYHLGKEPNLSHQFRDYRDALRQKTFGNLEEAIKDFATLAQVYRQFDTARDGALGQLRHVLSTLDLSVPTPLVLGILANVPDQNEIDKMLAIIESYLIRRFLCCLANKRYNQIFASAVSTLRKHDQWNSTSLREFFLSLPADSNEWPKNTDVIWRVCNRHSYGDIKGTGIAYVLARVEQSLRTNKSEGSWSYRTPLTIEHLMPQKWETFWPLEIPEDEDAKRKRHELKNQMGNLTIVTKSLNSSISNGPWEDKRKHLNEYSVLRMNSELASRQTWTEQDISNRSRSLGERFCELWPR